MRKTAPAETMPEPVLPPPLAKGDTIGLVRPAGPVQDQDHFHAGIRLLQEMGFAVRFARDSLGRNSGYLAGSDQERVQEFHQIWADPEVKAILAMRGGYGCMRLVEHLDMDLIRSQPKLLIGFSDISVLLAAITRATGLVTLHGPVLTTLPRCNRETIHSFFAAVSGRQQPEIKPRNLEVLNKGGIATGRLMGGNLTCLTHLLATPYEPSWNNILLFVEDVGESAYRLDRLFTQLKLAGRLDNLAGLILGSFSANLGEDFCETADDEQVWQRVLELLDNKKIPVWGNFPIGHGPNNQVRPLGVAAELDSGAGVLRLLGPCTAPRG
ncbi:MAG: LD-carboxypeptidase [Desulfobacterales bacterium]|nr:LD-carboxypeptidase [Desulfobacterales bacterium]